MTHHVHRADNLDLLRELPAGEVDLVYIDPPFNTGKTRSHTELRTTRDPEGDRQGFGGETYATETLGTKAFRDARDDYLGFLEPRLVELHRVLAPTGALYCHLDYREVHYVKVLLDGIFGREAFLNEIVWAYDFGGKSRSRWPAKHDTILYYAKDPSDYTFHPGAVDRIPYMAPGLVSEEKAKRGKRCTDVWWHTIVPTNGSERTGYPTQKPLGVVKRAIQASTDPGDLVCDVFAGSGTTGEAAATLGRRFLLCDENPEALEVMATRFAEIEDIAWHPPEYGRGSPPPRPGQG